MLHPFNTQAKGGELTCQGSGSESERELECGTKSYHSAAAAAEYTQEQAAGELPEQCLLQLMLSLTAPYLDAWCPPELKHTISVHMLWFWEHPRELLQVLQKGLSGLVNAENDFKQWVSSV